MPAPSAQESKSTPPVVRTAVVWCALIGGTLLLFWRASHFGFLNYDDPTYLTKNPHVQGGLSWAGIKWAFTAPADYWHPLTWLAHMLDWQLYGASAFGHHLTSIGWHALNAVLVFAVFRRLAGGFWRSAFAAALFAWHPLRVESVVWVTERKDVMSGCFFLLTLLAYERYVAARAENRPAWGRYFLTLACFVAGLMSKPMLVTVPLVLLILDAWPFRRWSSAASVRRVLLEKIPFLVLSLTAGVATLVMQRQSGAFVLQVPFGERAENAVVSLARYLGKFAWPFDLIVCYRHPGPWPVAAVVGAAVLVIGLCWVAWQQRRSRPWIAVGLGWFLITLLPVLGLVQVGFQAMADRYTYLPLLGIELALIWSVPVATSRAVRTGVVVLGVALLAACAWRTWNQEGVWHDSVSLFEHAVAVSHQNDMAEDLLASALFAANRINEAAVHAERACALNPRNATAPVTLAGIRERQGRVNDAIALYRTALRLRPDNPEVSCQLGLLEYGTGHPREAWQFMLPVIRTERGFRQRALEIGQTALQRGDLRSARFFHELVLAAAPDDAEAHAGLGYILILTGDRAGGIAQWHRALELDPTLPGLRERLAEIEK